MNNKYRIFLVIIASSLLFCCAQKPKSGPDYMVLDQIVFVESFPEEVTLEAPVMVNIDIFGGADFVIRDSLVIFSTRDPNGIWAFFSFPDYELLGRSLQSGNGPNELLHTPMVGTSTLFYNKNEDLCAIIHDYQKNRVLVMNIGSSLVENKLNISVVKDSLPSNLSSFIMIDSVTFFCRTTNYNGTQKERFLLENNVKTIPILFDKLNKSIVMPGEINILGAWIKFETISNRFVEVPMMLNYINIYSADGSFGKTICTDKKLDIVSNIQQLDKPDRIDVHRDVRVYDNMFGVLRVDDKYYFNRVKLPTIQFFNMDGAPLIELKLSHYATSFDINFREGHLYTFDFVTEEFYRYDIHDILKKISFSL